MNKHKPNNRLWTALSAVNAVALVYPVNLLRHADSSEDNLFAAFALMGVVLSLLTIDAVSIVVSGAFDTAKR